METRGQALVRANLKLFKLYEQMQRPQYLRDISPDKHMRNLRRLERQIDLCDRLAGKRDDQEVVMGSEEPDTETTKEGIEQ